MSITQKDYLALNKAAWNARTEFHIHSDFYDWKKFVKTKSSLNEIELNLLPQNLIGKNVLHLQCHFGQDTLSLAQLGASVTGVDLSDKAIEAAQKLALETQLEAKFICCDIYDLPNHLNEKFDIVFTTYGTIGWLPDLDKWAEIISRFLKPSGELIFVEFHPVVWMFDYDFKSIEYSYFNFGPIVETVGGTYANTNSNIQLQDVSWNHSLSEVIASLLKHNLHINEFNEFDYSPYNCFKNMEEYEKGKFKIAHLTKSIPMVYSIKAIKTQ
ncbi:MAG: class I SAM-dependent methyltransferase [Candidatus Methylacidiphilales bacterium]